MRKKIDLDLNYWSVLDNGEAFTSYRDRVPSFRLSNLHIPLMTGRRR